MYFLTSFLDLEIFSFSSSIRICVLTGMYVLTSFRGFGGVFLGLVAFVLDTCANILILSFPE